VYKSIGEKYGVKYSEDEILMRYRRAYEKPWGGSRLRYTFLVYINVATYWQFIKSGLIPVYLLCHTFLFPVCVLFLAKHSECLVIWCKLISWEVNSLTLEISLLFNWSDFVQVSVLSTPYESAWKLVYGCHSCAQNDILHMLTPIVHDILVTCINNVSQFSCYLL
jgi:hypothetical protein